MKLLNRTLEVRERLLGPAAYETLNTCNTMAMVLNSRGLLKEALAYFERSAKGTSLLVGEIHPNIAVLYSNMGIIHQSLHNNKEALNYQEKALAIVVQTRGPNSALAGSVHNNLGLVCDEIGKFDLARSHFEKALDIVRNIKPLDFDEEVNVLNSLAANATHRGRYQESELAYRKVMEEYRKIFPNGNSRVAVCAVDMAVVLDQQGKLTEGESLLRQALDYFEKTISLDHPDTLMCQTNLAANLSGQGRSAEAEPLYRKVLTLTVARFGERNSSAARLYNNLAGALRNQGHNDEAERLFRMALEIWEEVAGAHKDTADTLNNLAMFLAKTQPSSKERIEEAERLALLSLEMRRKLLGPTHPDTAQALNNLGGLASDRGDLSKAEQYYRDAYDINQRLDRASVDASDNCNNLAGVLMSRGRYDDAAKLYRESLAMREGRLGRDHPRTAQSYRNLGVCLHEQGNYLEAETAWLTAARSFETARLRIGSSGMERVRYSAEGSPLLSLSAVLARRGKAAEAWQRLEEHLGRGLLDEFTERRERKLSPEEREDLRRRLAEVEQLDRLVEAPIEATDRDIEKERLDDARHQRDQALIALGQLRGKLAATQGPIVGKVATLAEAQAALPEDAALISWVDRNPSGPDATDPSGDHWGIFLRAHGTPNWVRLPGTGKGQQWTKEDSRLPVLVRGAFEPSARGW